MQDIDQKDDSVILEVKHIYKSFPGVKALDDVDFSVRRGELHALVGENGAGKSTLMKIIAGIYKLDSGTILFKGKTFKAVSPSDCIKQGICTVHQELQMVPHLSVAENIFSGHLPMKKSVLGKVLDRKKMNQDAQALINSLGIGFLDVNTLLGKLSVAHKQIIEICKALSHNAEVIILDEPSATLTEAEVVILFQVLENLKKENVAIIYISHRLEEIFQIADRVTVLRDGKTIITSDIADFDRNSLIKHMVGREIDNIYPDKYKSPGDVILEVKGLSKKDRLFNISFSAKKGEILGITGLVGAGRSEVLRAIFGAYGFDEGEILINGKAVNCKTIPNAIKNKIGFLPEERKIEGFIPDFSIANNVTLVGINKILKRSFLNNEIEKQDTDVYIKQLRVATPSNSTKIKFLSGGNQQKVVISKWLYVDSDIIMFDEPTRGIDVGAKREIYKLLIELAEKGKAVIIVSSEFPEVLGVCNHVLVMHDGRITAELNADETNQEELLSYATM